MDAKLKHLEFIQATIGRMARNSFLLKGWVVTIVGGLLAISLKEINFAYIFISFAVLIFFWLLDSYYLYQEKLFICLYNQVRKLPEDKIDFTMVTTSFRTNVSRNSCSFSGTMWLFYGGLLLVHTFIILITQCYG